MFHIRNFVFSPIHENTYVLYNDSNECIIIDPGCYFDDEKQQLLDYVKKTGLVAKLLLNKH